MKNKPQLHEFNLSPYPRKLWIAISKSKFEDVFDDAFDFPENTDAMVEPAYNKQTKRGGILIRFESKKAMSVANVAHESTHAAMEVCDYIGGKIDLKNQEYFAYLVGYIARCCETVKNYKNKE